MPEQIGIPGLEDLPYRPSIDTTIIIYTKKKNSRQTTPLACCAACGEPKNGPSGFCQDCDEQFIKDN